MGNFSEGHANGLPGGKSAEQLRKDRWVFWGIVSLVPVLGLIVVGGPWAIGKYDEGHRTRIECTVTDANGGVSSASARGAASWSQVLIESSDCGTLTLSSGITESNRDEIAAELAQGGLYTFEIGEATNSLRWLTDVTGTIPKVWSFEKVS